MDASTAASGRKQTLAPTERRRLERLASLSDDRFRIPGTSIRFGLDAVVGLIPGVGDLASGALSAYPVWVAIEAGARRRTIARMGANVLIDMVVGSIPLVGDLFDVGFRANRRNVELLFREFGEPPPRKEVRSSRSG